LANGILLNDAFSRIVLTSRRRAVQKFLLSRAERDLAGQLPGRRRHLAQCAPERKSGTRILITEN
jgi:hypothetical protein